MISSIRPALLFTVVLFAFAQGSSDECLKSDYLKVFGAGKATYKNTIALVRLGIQVKGKTAREVQKQLAFESEKLTFYLKNEGGTEVKTSSVSISIMKQKRRGRGYSTRQLVSPRSRMLRIRRTSSKYPAKLHSISRIAPLASYVGRVTVSFESTIKKSGAIIRGAVKYGATQIAGVRFKASKEDASAARVAAIEDAVKNARREAEAAALASEKEIIAPVSIAISNVFVPRAKPARWGARRGMSAAAAPMTEIIGSVQKVNAFVSIAYEAEDLYEYGYE